MYDTVDLSLLLSREFHRCLDMSMKIIPKLLTSIEYSKAIPMAILPKSVFVQAHAMLFLYDTSQVSCTNFGFLVWVQYPHTVDTYSAISFLLHIQ